MITIDSLRNAYARSLQTGGIVLYGQNGIDTNYVGALKGSANRKERRAGANLQKSLGSHQDELGDFINYLGQKKVLNNYIGAWGASKAGSLAGEYNNYYKKKYGVNSGYFNDKDFQDVFRKLGKTHGNDLQGWWNDYQAQHRTTPDEEVPNAEERDIPDVEPGNGADEVPTPQNPNPGAGNTPNPGVGGGGGRRPVNPPIPELPELGAEIEIEEEPYEIPEDEQTELFNQLEDNTPLGVDYIDNSYDKMYHHASKNDLRQFRRGNDYTYGDGMFNTVKASDSNRANRQLVRGIRQGRREDARNYRKAGEYNYKFKEMPEYNGKQTNVVRGIMNGQYPSQRNGGAMMRTFIGAMRRGGRL